MRKRPCTIIGASLLGLLHVVTVVVPFTTGMVTGESTMYILVLDAPLFGLATHLLGDVYNQSQTFWKFYFSVFGTAMYILAGALLGYVCDKIRSRFGRTA